MKIKDFASNYRRINWPVRAQCKQKMYTVSQVSRFLVCIKLEFLVNQLEQLYEQTDGLLEIMNIKTKAVKWQIYFKLKKGNRTVNQAIRTAEAPQEFRLIAR